MHVGQTQVLEKSPTGPTKTGAAQAEQLNVVLVGEM